MSPAAFRLRLPRAFHHFAVDGVHGGLQGVGRPALSHHCVDEFILRRSRVSSAPAERDAPRVAGMCATELFRSPAGRGARLHAREILARTGETFEGLLMARLFTCESRLRVPSECAFRVQAVRIGAAGVLFVRQLRLRLPKTGRAIP